MADKISGIVINLFRVPLEEALYDAKHGSYTHFEIITASVTLEREWKVCQIYELQATNNHSNNCNCS